MLKKVRNIALVARQGLSAPYGPWRGHGAVEEVGDDFGEILRAGARDATGRREGVAGVGDQD